MKLRWTLLAISIASQAPTRGEAAERKGFDLAVTSVEVTDRGSSSMFRRVRVRCVILNHGPGAAPSKIRILVTRPSGNKRKVVRDIITKYSVPPGRAFFIAGEDTVWHAKLPTYRCAIDYGPPGAFRVVGDTNLANDIGQSTQSK